ncbi:hypothetical protein NQ317_015766 [Molorchus minor]|uniref:Protein N-terminal asparagine amidohydrolase n=1 Tax=Molorchus minor TaxID=1323400 RepID=A0ABQ9K2Y6_9CUCU|nr:hypothetical protein NQ317_015766 [Molorchus minor]
MVLVLNGVLQTKCPQDTQSLYNAHPVYRETAGQLLAIPNKVIGPVGLLYVQQREFAATVPHDKNVSIIGSDDATTCIIVVLRHSGSGAIALGHFDGSGTDEAVCAMVQRVQELALGYPEGRIELQLIGGIMTVFHKQPVEIDLTLACLGQLNSTIRGGIPWPIIYGIGVKFSRQRSPKKGPEEFLRRARQITGLPQVLDIYDCNLGLLRIGPFNYKPLRGVDLWLEQGDDFILQHLSTSPDVELPHFVMQMRTTLKYIQDNPFPAVTVFRDNRSHYFRRDEHSGIWMPVGF